MLGCSLTVTSSMIIIPRGAKDLEAKLVFAHRCHACFHIKLASSLAYHAIQRRQCSAGQDTLGIVLDLRHVSSLRRLSYLRRLDLKSGRFWSMTLILQPRANELAHDERIGRVLMGVLRFNRRTLINLCFHTNPSSIISSNQPFS